MKSVFYIAVLRSELRKAAKLDEPSKTDVKLNIVLQELLLQGANVLVPHFLCPALVIHQYIQS